MVELPPEAARLHGGRQILAGGGDDPDVYRFGAGTTEPADLSRLDGRQQLGLQGIGERSDLVEEQRTAVRGLEETPLGRPRVGEGPTLEAEQLCLEERLGNGSAVNVDEGAGAARSCPVEESGHQPFARARLPLARGSRAAGGRQQCGPAAASARVVRRARCSDRSTPRAEDESSSLPASAALAHCGPPKSDEERRIRRGPSLPMAS